MFVNNKKTKMTKVKVNRNNRRRIFWYLPLFCGLFSCTGRSPHPYASYRAFPEEITLQAEAIPLDTILFRYPFRIAVHKDVMLVLDLHNAEHYFHAFSCPEGKHIVSFGRRGQGPDEMLSAETFQFNSLDSVWALDANRQQITRWSLSPSDRTARRVEEVNLDKSLIRTLDFYVPDTGFIVTDYTGEYRFHRLDRQGYPVQSLGKIPAAQTPSDGYTPALAQAWRSFIDYSASRNRLAMATQLGEVLEIYPLNGDTPAVIYGPSGAPEFRVYQGEGIPTGIMGFSDIQIAGDRIYAIFQGHTFKEIQRASQQGRRTEKGGRVIYVFDLEGNPVKRYALDRAIKGIYVDEEENNIFAVDINSDEPVVRFKMQ
jgi:hypothetical protein